MRNLLYKGRRIVNDCRIGKHNKSEIKEYNEEVRRVLRYSDMNDTDSIILRGFYESTFSVWFSKVQSE